MSEHRQELMQHHMRPLLVSLLISLVFRFLRASPPIHSVLVTRQLATSIKVGHRINSRRLPSHPPSRRTQVLLLVM